MRRLAAVLVLLSLLLSGCWNRREIETLGFLVLLGIDYVPKTQMWELTMHVARPKAMVPSQSGGGGPKQVIMSASGRTVFDALREGAKQLPPAAKLWLGHIQAVIFGAEAARQGVGSPLDMLYRDGEMRRIIWVDVTPGTARELMVANVAGGTATGLSVTSLHKVSGATSEAVAVREFLIDLDSPVAATTGVLKLEKRPDQTPGYKLEGAAVFRGFRLAGYLNSSQTRGLRWARGQVRSGLLIVPCVHGKMDASLEVIHARGRMRPVWRNGRLAMQIRAMVDANIGDKMCPEQQTDEQTRTKLEAEGTQLVRAEIQSALDRAHELKADFFGFGVEIQRHLPDRWPQLEPNWHQGAFLDLPVEIQVQLAVRRSGLQNRAPQPKGWGGSGL